MQTLPHLQKKVRQRNGSMHLSKNTCSKLQYNLCLQRTITFRVVVTPELFRECHECVSQLAPFPFQFHVIPFPPLLFPRRGAPFPPPPPSSDRRPNVGRRRRRRGSRSSPLRGRLFATVSSSSSSFVQLLTCLSRSSKKEEKEEREREGGRKQESHAIHPTKAKGGSFFTLLHFLLVFIHSLRSFSLPTTKYVVRA